MRVGVHRNGVRKRSRVDIALSTLDDDEFVFMMAMVMDYGNEVRYRDGYRYVALEKKKIVVDWVLGFGRHYVCFHDYFGICDMIMIDDDECLSVWIV